jgi:uncharacterized protein (TIGR02611 family)
MSNPDRTVASATTPVLPIDPPLQRHLNEPSGLGEIVADVADDPISRPRQILRVIRRSSRALAITVVGFSVLAAGIAMMVLPGPGLLVIMVGLAILAREFVWAERLLIKARQRAAQGTDAAKRMFRRKRA